MASTFPLQTITATPRQLKAYLDRFVVGQESAKHVLATAVVTHYRRLRFEQEHSLSAVQGNAKHNVLLIGSTGTGKTLLAELAAGYIGVPRITVDATALTQAGYVGEEIERIPARLFEAADNLAAAQVGIVYIDEIDKISSRTGAYADEDVSTTGVQEGLLKIVEGTTVPQSGRGDKRNHPTIDTHNMLFIAGGAFEHLDELERAHTKRMGFGRSGEEATSQHLTALLHEHGMMRQLIGRFPNIVRLHELGEEHMREILSLPNTTARALATRDFAAYGIELVITEPALDEIAASAYARGMGARGIKTVLDSTLGPYLFSLPDFEIERLEITPQTVHDPEGTLAELVHTLTPRAEESTAHSVAVPGIEHRPQVYTHRTYRRELTNLGTPRRYSDFLVKYGMRTKNITPRETHVLFTRVDDTIGAYFERVSKERKVTLQLSNATREVIIHEVLKQERQEEIDAFLHDRFGQYLPRRITPDATIQITGEIWKSPQVQLRKYSTR